MRGFEVSLMLEPKQAVEQTAEFPSVWDDMTLMRRNYNLHYFLLPTQKQRTTSINKETQWS